MTTITTERTIILHRVPGDPVRARITDALEKRVGAGWQHGFTGDMAEVAAQLGIDEDAAFAVLGIKLADMDPWTWDRELTGHVTDMRWVVPDGIRACFAEECQHCLAGSPTSSPIPTPTWSPTRPRGSTQTAGPPPSRRQPPS